MQLGSAVGKLWEWLSTWMDEQNGVHGYTVHHHFDNLKVLSPDLWTQAPLVLGSLRLFQKTREKKWLSLCLKLSNFLANNYDGELHTYLLRNHGEPILRFPGLIQPALSSYALLEVASEIREEKDEWRKHYLVAKDNIDNGILNLWDEKVGALRTPEITGLSRKHTHNMNSVAILALIKLSETEENPAYMNHASKIAKYILACHVKTGKLAGAIPYRDQVKNYITLYTLITLLGLTRLYEKTSDTRLLKSMQLTINGIAKALDRDTSLVCHYHRKGFPQWIPDTLLFTLLTKRLEKLGMQAKDVDADLILAEVLKRQYPHGGFPLSIGFEDIWAPKELPSRPSLKRWRDVLPTPNWNAWNFWVLSELLEEKQTPHVEASFPLTLRTDREESEGPYTIIEKKQDVRFLTDDNTPKGIFKKTSDVAKLCSITERDEYWRQIKPLERYPTIFLKGLYWFSKHL